jgi:hypothetical protein
MSPHTKDESLRPMPEQVVYANILNAGAWIGIAIMTVAYILYVSGIIAPHVDLLTVTQNWGKDVHTYMQNTGAVDGWSWLGLLNTGDYLNFIGLAFLALLTIICYLVLVPGYYRRKNWSYLAICLAEVVVLSLAASGIFGSGGH